MTQPYTGPMYRLRSDATVHEAVLDHQRVFRNWTLRGSFSTLEDAAAWLLRQELCLRAAEGAQEVLDAVQDAVAGVGEMVQDMLRREGNPKDKAELEAQDARIQQLERDLAEANIQVDSANSRGDALAAELRDLKGAATSDEACDSEAKTPAKGSGRKRK